MVGNFAVQDGRIESLRRAYSVLTQPDVAATDLRVLSRLLERAKARRDRPEAVVATVQQDVVGILVR